MDRGLLAHLAELSKLAFSEEQLSVLGSEMEAIVKLMDTVKEFSSGNNPRREGRPLADIREDRPSPSYPTEEILKNAAARNGSFFSVPKVVE